MSDLLKVWSLALRLTVGGFWLFFSSQRWIDRTWVKELLQTATAGNYLPIYRDLLRILLPHWEPLTLFVTILETVIGVMIILGIYPRFAAIIGFAIATNLLLTFSFCRCPWNEVDAPQVFWFYFSAALLNLAVARERFHRPALKLRRKTL